MPVTFPTTALVVTVRIAPGADRTADPATWTFADVTDLWHVPDEVTIKHGRSEGATEAESSQLTITFKGANGDLMPEYALSPHAPGWAEGCPIELLLNAGDGDLAEFSGFVTSIVPEWPGNSGGLPLVRVQAQGLLAQLEQGKAGLQSALRRKVAAASGVVAWWALEGGPDITAAESTLSGGSAMVPIRGGVAPAYAGVDGPAGSGSLPDFSSHGVLVAPVRPYTDTGEWQVEAWFRTDTGDSLDFTASVPVQWDTPGGTVVAWDAVLLIGQGAGNVGLGKISVDVTGYTAPLAGGTLSESERLVNLGEYIVAIVDSVQGSWHQLRVCAEQASPTQIRLRVYLNDVELGDTTFALFTGPATLGPVTRMTVNPLQGEGQYLGVDGLGLSSVGGVVVYNTTADPGTYQAGLGYPGESAGDRLARLGAEAGIDVTVEAGDTALMGPQLPGRTLLELFRECEATDRGILAETGWGLRYRPLRSLYNQAIALTVDVSAHELGGPYKPKTASRYARNEWTVEREGGLSATERDEAHQLLKGVLDDRMKISAASDTQLPHAARWLVNEGTASGLRLPQIGLNFEAAPQLISAWRAMGEGDRMQVINPPRPYTATADLVMIGRTTTLRGRKSWKAVANCAPASPYGIAVYGTHADQRGRYGVRYSTLAAAVDADDTALLVSPNKDVWMTTAGHPGRFPFDVDVDGLTYECTANSGPAFVSAGTAAHADNASVSPGLPAGSAAGDLLLIWAAIRSSGGGTVGTPVGYTSLLQFGNTRLLGKVHSGSESAPTVTFSGGSAGDTTSAQMCAFRRMDTGLADLGRLVTATQLNASAQDIALPEPPIPSIGAQVWLYLGWKQDDWTSVAPMANATEIGEPDSTTGSDQGLVWAYRILQRARRCLPASFVATGGGTAISRGAVVSLAGLYELTVTRLADDKSHLATRPVTITDTGRLGK